MKSILQVVQNLIKPYIDKIASAIAPVEVSPSEHAYTVGRQIIYNGVLYTVTSAIAVNDNLEVGVNIISSSNVLTQMGNKLSTYTTDATAWDTTPTASSTKPVTSDGIYQALSSITVADMTGATSSTDGTHGLVPAPLIADREKFLRGDGTWQTVAVERSYVGMIIHSTTLNTADKVKAFYGGTTWIQHSGYVLRGATSGVTANSATKTGGADSVTLSVNQMPSHSHTHNAHQHKYGATYQYMGDGSGTGYTVLKTKNADTGQGDYYTTSATTSEQAKGGSTAVSTLPNYKSVYIWERTV